MKTHCSSHTKAHDPGVSFKLFLQTELAQRCAKNPQYSLRALANYLGVDHSTLSQLMRGKRRLTEQAIRRLGVRLGLDAARIAGYVDHEKLAGNAPREEAHTVSAETAALIGAHPHYAILELLRLQAFRPDTRWIAHVLDVSTDEVNMAITRLIHLDLLSMEDQARWVALVGDTVTDITRVDSQHVAQWSAQASRRRVATKNADHAHQSTSVLAIDARRIPEAMERIARFRRELHALLHTDRADDVYQLELHLFPLTRIQKEAPDGKPRDEMADPSQES